MLSYLEERWDDLDAVRHDFPPYGALGDFLMLDIALAYSRADNQERFAQAMQFIKTVHDDLKSQGASSNLFLMNEAAHLAMAGDLEGSLDYLDRAISGGMITSLRITQGSPYLEPLEGDPRFEAIQARMVEHLDSERAKLGLEPATI